MLPSKSNLNSAFLQARWRDEVWLFEHPFKYLIIDDFFKPSVYRELVVAMEAGRTKGSIVPPETTQREFLADPANPSLGLLASREFSDFIGGIFGIRPLRPGAFFFRHDSVGQSQEQIRCGGDRLSRIKVVFFLNNKSRWRDADGGQLGVYSGPLGDDIAAKIAPINNRLYVHEASPGSWHRFLRNNTFERSFFFGFLEQTEAEFLAQSDPSWSSPGI